MRCARYYVAPHRGELPLFCNGDNGTVGATGTTADFAALDALLLPMDTAIADLPQLMLSLEQAQEVIFGQRIKLEQPPAAALYQFMMKIAVFLVWRK